MGRDGGSSYWGGGRGVFLLGEGAIKIKGPY